MKLSIEQYNEIFKNRSITDYTKFNWSGEMPVLYTLSAVNEDKNWYNLNLVKGKKYIFQVITPNQVESSGVNYCIILQGQRYVAPTLNEKLIVEIGNNYIDVFSIYNKTNKPIEVKISEYVENLIAESEIYQDLGTRTGDHYIWKLPNTTRSLIKRFNGSNFEYGDYRFNYNIDYLEALPKSKLVCFLWNNNKNKSITSRNASDTTSWTFTLTPENYTVGDDLVFEIYPTITETAGTVVEIDNLYLCKIQDNWKCIDAGSIDYRRYFNEDAQKYYYGLDSQLPERKPNGNVYVQSYNKVNSWPDFWNNTEVYLAGTNIYLRNDSITTEEALKTSLSGKVLMYEKQ